MKELISNVPDYMEILLYLFQPLVLAQKLWIYANNICWKKKEVNPPHYMIDSVHRFGALVKMHHRAVLMFLWLSSWPLVFGCNKRQSAHCTIENALSTPHNRDTSEPIIRFNSLGGWTNKCGHVMFGQVVLYDSIEATLWVCHDQRIQNSGEKNNFVCNIISLLVDSGNIFPLRQK